MCIYAKPFADLTLKDATEKVKSSMWGSWGLRKGAYQKGKMIAYSLPTDTLCSILWFISRFAISAGESNVKSMLRVELRARGFTNPDLSKIESGDPIDEWHKVEHSSPRRTEQ
jgi:hypothetical protein